MAATNWPANFCGFSHGITQAMLDRITWVHTAPNGRCDFPKIHIEGNFLVAESTPTVAQMIFVEAFILGWKYKV